MLSMQKTNYRAKAFPSLHPQATGLEGTRANVVLPWRHLRPSGQEQHAAHALWISRSRKLASLMDAAWGIPGTKFRFGADSLLGLIPGAGDALTASISAYLLYGAWRHGTSNWTLVRMAGNILIDLLFGSIPLLGDLFDFMWKSNQRNVRLLEREFAHLIEKPEAHS